MPPASQAASATRSAEFVMHVTEASLGGLRRHIADLMHGLQALGVSQVLVYSAVRADAGMRRLLAWCESTGISVIELPMQRRIAPLDDARAVASLRGHIRRIAPTVLHLHSSKAGGVGRLAALGIAGLKVVYTPNGLATHLSPAYAVVERALGYLRTDRLIAVSASEHAEISAARILAPRLLARIDSGISIEETRRLVGESIEPSFPTVVFVGRLSAQKDPLFALDVSARVVASLPSTRFVWVGDGELRGAFTSQMEKRDLQSHWMITGWVENPYPFVASATVCALMSRYESFGYVTLEAMSLGKAVVATRVSGSTDLVDDGRTGFLVPLDDAVASADCLIRLLSDGELRHEMEDAALARATLFSRDRMARETLDLYESIS